MVKVRMLRVATSNDTIAPPIAHVDYLGKRDRTRG
jgi:hypothetical protein